MAKKPNTKKTLKSLFSKSEANLSDSTVAELGSNSSVDRKASTEKKKFKFPGLKIKSKSSGASEKAEQVQSAEKPGLNVDSLADNVSTETDHSSMYATAPRSKGKDLSGSDVDLSSKPKRFATINLGMRKKKKKEESVLSKSTFGLDSSGIETPSDISQMPLAQINTKNMSKSQPELDTSKIFDIPSPPPVSVYKPEFPRPSETSVTVHSEPIKPPPVLNITNDAPKAPIATIPELKLDDDLKTSVKETTSNESSNKDVASTSSKVEKLLSDLTMPKFDTGNNALVDNGNIQASNTKLEIPIGQPAQLEKPLEIKTGANDLKISTTLDDKPKLDTATAVNSKTGITIEEKSNTIIGNSVLDQKMAATNLSNQVESFAAISNTPSVAKPDEFDGKINETPVIYSNVKSAVYPITPSLQVSGNYDNVSKTTSILSQSKMVDQDEPKTGVTIEDTQPNINNAFATDPKIAAADLDKRVESSETIGTISSVGSASKPANLDTKISETTTIYSSEKSSSNSVTPSVKVSQKTSTFSSQSKMAGQEEEKVYGVLYNSLFPQNFTQEVVSSFINTQLSSEYKSLETVLVTQFDSEKVSTPLSTSSPEKTEEHLSAFSTVSTNILNYVEEKSPKDAPKTVYIRKVTTYDATSSNDAKPVVEDGRFAYSEFSTEPKYDTGHIRDTMKPSTYTEKSPPLLNCVPSQETNAQVSAESKRKVVLVRELVSDEATTSASSSNRDSGCPTPVMEKMSTTPSSEMKMEEFDMFSVTSGQTDGICSPAYLSVGSDDGSAIFYSAEEDNSDDLFTADATVIDATKEGSVLEDQAGNRTIVLREDANVSVSSTGKVFERPIKQVETQEKSGDTVFRERELMKAKVEHLAPPVERVKEFQVVPPFAETIGRKEGLGISQIELKDTPVVEKDFKNELARNANISKLMQECSSASNKSQITPKFAEEAEEQVLSTDVKESVLVREISGAGGNNRAAVSVQEVDTVTERAGRSRDEQVAIAAAQHSQTSSTATTILQKKEDRSRKVDPGLNQDQGPSQDQEQPDLRQGSLPSSQTPAPPQNFPGPNSMSSGYSSLSTTLSFKTTAPTQLDDPKNRLRKVSLVSESKLVDSNGAGPDMDYKWRNRLEGVTQFRPLSDTQNAKDYTSISSKSNLSLSLSDRLDSTDGGGGSGRGPTERREGPSQAPAVDRREPEPDGVRSQPVEEDSSFSGVFKAILVDLEPELPTVKQAGAFVSPPGTPDEADDSPSQFDMDNLVDTLKSMGPSMRMRSLSGRGGQPSLLTSSSLPPIVEDAPNSTHLNNTVNNNKTEVDGLNGNIYSLPPDIGLKKSTGFRDMRSPLELLKQEQQAGSRTLPMQLRASATNSIVMRASTDDSSSPEEQSTPVQLNGSMGSRLDHSLIFSSLRSSSVDQTSENNVKPHRSLFRASSLPDFGEDYASRISRAPPLSIGPPPSGNSPPIVLSPTGSLEMNRPFADLPIRVGPTSLLQRSFNGDSGVSLQQGVPFNNVQNFQNHFQTQEPEPERNLLSKYRAFPDAYLTKEKEHGKLNPRPGKMYIFDQPGMCGQRTEIRSDVTDATSWELQETISIRVVRGGWVLYEKPDFKGNKIALDEGEVELTNPFRSLEEEVNSGQMNGQTNTAQTNGDQGETSETQTEKKPAPRFIIGSIRRAVRDYSVPEISLFPEQNAEGKKVVFRDSSEDARIFGFPVKANSIVINAGLWLVYAEPFFQGVPRVLEVGGYTNPEAWGVEQPYVSSLHPLKIGEPRVENMAEAKMVVFEKPYFCGKSRTISTNSRDFMTRTDNRQMVFMHNVGSLKVMGGIWVGYEKEGFRGHQYLLEEGDYQDWRVWGGVDAELRSVRVLQAELTDPVMVMFEQLEEEQEEQEGNTFEVTEAIPDVELFGFKTSTRSIQVVSGAWVAYSHVDFSGSQYILEKGFYNNSADWGALDGRICSVQPILMVPRDDTQNRNQITLYNEPGFQGQCLTIDRNQEALSDKLMPKSCRVVGGSWVLYENKQFQGNQYVLSEGDYPNLNSMGCPTSCFLRSVKAVPMTLSVPSISLFGLECLEGREITMETEIFSLVEEGYNNHILSVRVNTGSWVVCEHSNYRGRQFLLEPIEITNWPKFSSMQTIGSMYPVRQKRSLFRVKNTSLGCYLSVQGGVEEMKSGRVVVTPEVEPMSDVWYYQDGLIKNKLASTMCLQVMGNVEPAAKVVLWAETRQPIQTWTAQMRGLITNLTFPGMVLDVKGGKTYDKSHVVIMPEDDERPSQQWEIEML